jgi:predicted permease
MPSLLKDLRYGVRLLLRSPGFTVVALASLALGIGANTAVFCLVSALLLRPLPVRDVQALVSVFQTDERNPGNLPLSDLNFKDWRADNNVFTGMAAVSFAQVNRQNKDSKADELQIELVTGNYFDLLGVRLPVGRGFQPDEDRALGAAAVAVLSWPFWQAQFGGDPLVLGRTLELNRQAFTVIGVAPRTFSGTFPVAPALWVPMTMHAVVQPNFDWYEKRRGLFLFPFGRLKPGVTLEQARANLKGLMTQLARAFPNDNRGRSADVLPLLESRINLNGQGQVRTASVLLLSLVGIVLLIACANIANLQLARGAKRRRELAVRIAVGADRGRLVRQLLTESVFLSLLGGALGLLLARWLVQGLAATQAALPIPVADAELDTRVLLFTLAVATVTGLLFGVAPALDAARTDVTTSIKEESVPSGVGRRFTMRKGLVVTQVTLSFVSLVAAGLFIRSLGETARIEPGFDTAHVATLSINLGREGYTEDRGAIFYRDLAERALTLPGVKSAAVAESAPLGGTNITRSVFLDEQDTTGRDRRLEQVNFTSPAFFRTVGIPLLKGRDFDERDTVGSPLVAIVTETFARDFWPGKDPIGRRFRFFGDAQPTEVVGLAADSKINNLAESPTALAYSPFRQSYRPAASLLVRVDGPAALVAPNLRKVVADLDPAVSILQTSTLAEQVDQSLTGQRTTAVMLSVFGGLALLLASIGLYGVASFSVSQRTREIGVRMALGARPVAVLGVVLRQSMAVVAVGLGLGLAAAVGGALATKSALASLLVNVRVTDPGTLAATAALLAVVALVASVVPARRAARIDPLLALRQD